MVKRAARVRLIDMLAAIDEADATLGNADFAAYQRSTIMWRALERCAEIVSEACRRIPPDLAEVHAAVPWPEIMAIGNRPRHDCQRVDDHIMWRIAAKSLPELRPVIVDLLARVDRNPC
ncbi:MAG: HepT-like ribonuclease domain-containing protein [Pseudomonadota bacterium]